MIITLDFETEPIERMPNYPPEPVGVALKFDDQPATYMAWGHHNGTNNCTWEQARDKLWEICRLTFKGARLVMHNAKFDLAVLEHKLNMVPNTNNIDDTMILAFLHNPYETKLSLKPLAEKYLKRPAEERDLMGEWLLENVRMGGKKLSTAAKSDNYYVKYTAWAPPELAGPYAMADVDMTYELYMQMSAYIKQTGMEKAYAREIALIPILIENEMGGVRVDADRLGSDVDAYGTYLAWIDDFIRYHLHDDGLNIDSDDGLNKAMLDAGLLDKTKLKLTKTGKYSMSKKGLAGCFTDPRWEDLLAHRSQVSTCLNTFMKPWSEMAQNEGLIYTSWNQTRGPEGGSRTGRFSSSPNFQNIPKLNSNIHETLTEAWGQKFWPTPKVRSYIIPWEKDWVLLDRDYSQQEIRIMAHFGATPGPGELMAGYEKDPSFDFHDHVQKQLKYTYGIDLERKLVKNTNFAIMYGGGAPRISEVAGISKEDAKELRSSILGAVPDLKYLYDETAWRAREGQPIRTWGGRWYYVEPSREIDGRMVDFAYKMVNYLIQGSAADCTKQAWINLGGNSETLSKNMRTYLTVHDEFLITCPKKYAKAEMHRLKTAMESVQLDLPLKSDGKISYTNWSELEKYDDGGL